MTQRNLRAVNRSVRHLMLGPECDASVELVRSLARLVDADGGDDRLWREYRMALGLLLKAGSGGDSDGWRRVEDELRAAMDDAAGAKP